MKLSLPSSAHAGALGFRRAIAALWRAVSPVVSALQRNLAFALCVAIACATLVWNASGYWTYQLVDDAGIVFSYARSLARGDGLVLTPHAERVEGSTSFLWTLVLAVPEIFGVSCVPWSQILGVAFAAVALIVVALIPAALERRSPRPGDAVVPVGAAIFPLYAQWAVNGLETGLMAFMIALSLLLFTREDVGLSRPRRVRASAIAAVLLFLTRPDGLLYIAVFTGVTLLRLLGPTHRRASLFWIAAVAAGLSAFELFRLAYFAVPWPSTFYAKQPDVPLQTRLFDTTSAGWLYVKSFVQHYDLKWLLLFIPFAAVRRSGWGAGLALVGFTAAAFFFPIHSQGDWMVEYRFLSPSAPVLLLAIAEGARVVAKPIGAGLARLGFDRSNSLVAAAAVICCLVLPEQLDRRSATTTSRSTTYRWVAVRAKYYAYLAQRLSLPASSSVADPDAGATAHLSTLTFRDLVGLTDLSIALAVRKPGLFREIVFDDWRPTFIHLHWPWTVAFLLEPLEEMSYGYFTLPAKLPEVPDISDFVPVRLRRETVAAPWMTSSNELPASSIHGGANLRGVTPSHLGLEPGRPSVVDLRFHHATKAAGSIVLVENDGRESVVPIALGAGIIPTEQYLDGERAGARVELRPKSARAKVFWRAANGTKVQLFALEQGPGAGKADGAALARALDAAIAGGRLEEARRLSLRCALRLSKDPQEPEVRRAFAGWTATLTARARAAAKAGAPTVAAALGHEIRRLGDVDPSAFAAAVSIAPLLSDAAIDAERRGDAAQGFALARAAVELDPRRSWSRRRAERLRAERFGSDQGAPAPTTTGPASARRAPFIYDGARDQMAYRLAARASVGAAGYDEALALLGTVGRFREAAHLARLGGVVPGGAAARFAVARGQVELGLVPSAALADACTLAADPELASAIEAWAPGSTRARGACATPAVSQEAAPLDGGAFEGDTFAPWSVTGRAFGRPSDAPRVTAQQASVGWSGRRFADSLAVAREAGRGRLVSPPFVITTRGLSFVVGGGSRADVGVRLLVDGAPTALRAAGRDDTVLRRVFWDVSQHMGRRAQIEIYDDVAGGWGFIQADDFRFEAAAYAW